MKCDETNSKKGHRIFPLKGLFITKALTGFLELCPKIASLLLIVGVVLTVATGGFRAYFVEPINANIELLRADVKELETDVKALDAKIDRIHLTLDNHMNENFKELRGDIKEVLVILATQNNNTPP